MNFYNAMATVVPAKKKTDMEAVSGAFTARAVEFTGGDQSQLMQAVKATADRASASVVGKTQEDRFAVHQSCSAYLQEDGVEKALAERSAKK